MTLAQAQDIQLESLNDGPGILPFKLGPAKIISHYHTFLQDIDLDLIQQQIDTTRMQLYEFTQKLSNNNFSLFKYQILHLTNKIEKIIAQLNTFRQKRTKRGLINPLGSVIKSITGNLDYNDALRYEEILHILQKNQEDVSNSLNNHITLYKQMTFHQTEVLTNLTKNQLKLEKAFMYFINASNNQKEQVTYYANLSQVLAAVTESVHDLVLEIDRLENIVAFSRTSTVHHSILNLNNLNEMISKLKGFYNQDQIINLEDIRYYYNLISLGCYFVGNKLIIVLKFPISIPSLYYLYHLCPVPNKHSVVIIPPSPYLATNSKEFVYMEAECPKVDNVYICKHQTSYHTKTRRDCIFTLIHLQEIDETCNPTPISLPKEALMELDDQHYIISFQQPTKVQVLCGQDRHQILKGSYLATIPKTCSIKTSDFTITNVNNKLRGNKFEILTLSSSQLNALSSSRNQKPNFNITAIDLNKLHDIQHQITMEVPVKSNNSHLISTYHTTISLYVIVIPCIIALFIIYFLRNQYRKKEEDAQNSNIEISLQPCSSTAADSSRKSQLNRKSAIFALDVGK